MAEAKVHALYDPQGALVNVILWDGEAALPDGHKAELYVPEKHAAEWAAASSPDGVVAAETTKPRKSRLLGR